MLFYFSATGNSLAAAKALRHDGEALLDMAQALKNGQFTFTLEENERLGFVFPVYYYSLPDVVYDFVQKLRAENAGYVFAVVTCGASIGGSAGLLKALLEKRGVLLQYAAPLVMPDNCMIYYQLDDEAAVAATLQQADAALDAIRADLAAQTENEIAPVGAARLLRGVYHTMCGTKAFFVTDACVHCGLCARICPVNAIALENGSPRWVKSKCVKCTACINRCPAAAIQHGKKTAERRRYAHPALRGKNS